MTGLADHKGILRPTEGKGSNVNTCRVVAFTHTNLASWLSQTGLHAWGLPPPRMRQGIWEEAASKRCRPVYGNQDARHNPASRTSDPLLGCCQPPQPQHLRGIWGAATPTGGSGEEAEAPQNTAGGLGDGSPQKFIYMCKVRVPARPGAATGFPHPLTETTETDCKLPESVVYDIVRKERPKTKQTNKTQSNSQPKRNQNKSTRSQTTTWDIKLFLELFCQHRQSNI